MLLLVEGTEVEKEEVEEEEMDGEQRRLLVIILFLVQVEVVMGEELMSVIMGKLLG